MTYAYTMRTYENDYLRKLEVQYHMILGLLVSLEKLSWPNLPTFLATFQPTKARGVAEELAQELLRFEAAEPGCSGWMPC